MIAMTVGGIVLASVMTAFMSQHKNYLSQDEIVELQQNGRVAMDMLVRDIYTIGYDPNDLDAGIVSATANTLTFTRDDGLTPNGLETISYTLYDAFASTTPPANDGLVDDLAIKTTTAAGTSAGNQAVAENINQFFFRYLDSDGEVITTPVSAADEQRIRSIQVSVLVVASISDPGYTNTNTYTSEYTSPLGIVETPQTWGPANDNLHRHLFIKTIKCRNLGI
jgi:type IV pilus assembly protein PilW